jgi:predicted AAA+ superfamily ATPase
MFERFVERRVEEALADTPVVLIVGPRRAGKTTLVRKMGKPGGAISRSTIRRSSKRRNPIPPASSGAWTKPSSMRSSAPDLLLAIKKSVDEDYRPGRFLLTGSANVLTLPRVADSLAGRMETIQMLPLARAEIEARAPTFWSASSREATGPQRCDRR